jgi:hypothetical protein
MNRQNTSERRLGNPPVAFSLIYWTYVDVKKLPPADPNVVLT